MPARAIICALALSLMATPALAQWDLSSISTVDATWADNVDYSGSRQVNDPNNPGNTRLVRGDPDGDTLTNIRLRGLAAYQSARWRFNGYYEPRASVYRDRSDLNRVSHTGQVSSILGVTRNTDLNISDRFVYSPDQGASGESFNTPVLITNFSDRRSNQLRVNLSTRLSELTTISYGVSHRFQLFSGPELTDTVRMGADLRWNRMLTDRAGVELTGMFFRDRFERFNSDDPNTIPNEAGTERDESHGYNALAGGTFGIGSAFTAQGRVGFDLIVPNRQGLSNRRGFRADVNAQYQGDVITTQAGYNRALNTGSGLFAVSRTQTIFLNIRALFGDHVSGLLFANQSFSKNAANNDRGTVDTLSGGASVEVMFNQAISGRVQISANEQTDGQGDSSNIDFNRVSVGLVVRAD